jgi:hypothetical protein
MQDTLGNNGSLSRTKFDRSAFEVDQQLPLDYVEEFVVVIMLVPVVLTLYTPRRTTEPFT